MLKPEMVPKAVLFAFGEALYTNASSDAEAIAAALSAWPGMHIHEWRRPWLGGMSGTDLILPLPTEASDD